MTFMFACSVQNTAVGVMQGQHSVAELGSRLALKGLPHLHVVLSLSRMWRLLGVRVQVAVCRRQAITGFRRFCVCLCPSLSRDRVEQRHGNSLSGLLKSRYQVLDLPEISFLHTRSSLKHKQGN